MSNRNAAKHYLINQIENLSSLERLLVVYDVAIKACDVRDREKVSEAIQVLQHSLNTAPNHLLSEQLNQLYHQIQIELEHSSSVDWPVIQSNLKQLRDIWSSL